MPGYAGEAGWNNEAERDAFIQKNRLRFMRDYQKRAVQAIQDAVAEGQSRFLFEMATGTGKTLTAAAVIKLFLRTGNARRVLFLVDRLELEDQANKAFISSCSKTITPQSSTRRAATNGARPRLSSPPCNRCCSTTNTSACFRRPTLTW